MAPNISGCFSWQTLTNSNSPTKRGACGPPGFTQEAKRIKLQGWPDGDPFTWLHKQQYMPTLHNSSEEPGLHWGAGFHGDILVNIMCHVNDPRNLYSAIRASPALYAIFRHMGHRETILHEVVSNAFMPEARKAALAVVRCQRFLQGQESHQPATVVPLNAGATTHRNYFVSDIEFLTNTFPHDEYKTLCQLSRLWYLVRRFLVRYVMHTLKRDQQLPSLDFYEGPNVAGPHGPLTALETKRLQRGFCNFEVGARLCSLLRNNDVRKAQAEMCLELPVIELEEVLCVTIFVKDQYDKLWEGLNCSMDAILRPLGECINRLEKGIRTQKVEKVLDDIRNHLSFPMPTYVERAQASQNLMAGGLRCLDNLLRANSEFRYLFLKQTLWRLKVPGTVFSLINGARDQPWKVARGSEKSASQDIMARVQHVCQSGKCKLPARLLHNPRALSHKDLTDTTRASARDLGWIFWGTHRLRIMDAQTCEQLAAIPVHRKGDGGEFRKAHYLARGSSSIESPSEQQANKEGGKGFVKAMIWVEMLQKYGANKGLEHALVAARRDADEVC